MADDDETDDDLELQFLNMYKEKTPVTLLFLSIQGFEALRCSCDLYEDMERMYLDCLKHALIDSNAYEVNRSLTLGSFVACLNIESGVAFAIGLQRALQNCQWPPSMCAFPNTQPVKNRDGLLILNGLRVRIGIHVDRPETHLNEQTNRLVFSGEAVGKTAQVSTVAKGGEIVTSVTATEALIKAKSSMEQWDFELTERGCFIINREPIVISIITMTDCPRNFSVDTVVELLCEDYDEKWCMFCEGHPAEEVVKNWQLISFDDVLVGRRLRHRGTLITSLGKFNELSVDIMKYPICSDLEQRSVAVEKLEVKFNMLYKLKHEHILTFIGAVIDESYEWRIFDHVPDCQYVRTILLNQYGVIFPRQAYIHTMIAVVSAITYLQGLLTPIVLRDLSCDTLLLNKKFDPFISSFDHAIEISKDEKELQIYDDIGFSPEETQNKRVTINTDVFAIGILFIQLSPSFEGHLDTVDEIREKSHVNSYPPIYLDEQLKELANRALDPSPERRLCIFEVAAALEIIQEYDHTVNISDDNDRLLKGGVIMASIGYQSTDKNSIKSLKEKTKLSTETKSKTCILS